MGRSMSLVLFRTLDGWMVVEVVLPTSISPGRSSCLFGFDFPHRSRVVVVSPRSLLETRSPIRGMWSGGDRSDSPPERVGIRQEGLCGRKIKRVRSFIVPIGGRSIGRRGSLVSLEDLLVPTRDKKGVTRVRRELKKVSVFVVLISVHRCHDVRSGKVDQ